jgi:cysteine-rich repeat protein/parallel beta-helix repeat protein
MMAHVMPGSLASPRALSALLGAALASGFLTPAERSLEAAVYTVAEAGGDFAGIQAALDVAQAGDVIQVRAKAAPYFEKLSFPRSGAADAGPITLEAAPGERPILDGTGLPGANMVLIENRSYVKLIGFEIRNNLGVDDGSGVRILGAGSHIEVRGNRIHDIRGRDAMGITVYGTEPGPISDLVIDGNEIYDCEPARSEALTLNGNVTDFQVTNNFVHDVNNIGIDFIGGETDIQPDPALVARNGVCRGNRVFRANANYGGGAAGGIYVDGGRDIVIEGNVVSGSDYGIEVGAENPGIVTSGIVVRDNLLYANEKVCIIFGGFEARRGRVQGSVFSNNTCFGNDTLADGNGELKISFAEGNLVRNNVFYGTAQNRLLYSDEGNVGNVLDYNLWFTPGAAPAEFVWNGEEYGDFAAYQAGTGQDAHSRFLDPGLVDPAGQDFHVTLASPGVDAGDPAFVAGASETDFDGGTRVTRGAVDIGADEVTVCGDGLLEVPETCDDGNRVAGDGCDSNCTPTGCGNGVVTTGEACDDGNLTGGDCCGATCEPEAAGSRCDDEGACTTGDACDGAGRCVGATAPSPDCRASRRGTLTLRRGKRPSKDRLVWTWAKGTASAHEFGDPVSGRTSFQLCVYDHGGLVHKARARGGRQCGQGPCWTGRRTGYRYRDPSRKAGGLARILLKADAAGRAKLMVTGGGPALGLAILGRPLVAPFAVELRSSEGECWGGTY